MDMCHRLHDENGVFEMVDKKVRYLIQNCIFGVDGKPGNTIVGVIGEPGHIEASICLMIANVYYTNDWHLEEFWNFVDKPYRRSRNAEALIEFAKGCADKMQIPLLTGIITNKQMAGKVRLYRRLLGYPTGAYFLYNADKWKPEPMEDHNDLRFRLKEYAAKCSDGKVTPSVARRELAPLLAQAVEAIHAEDSLWGDGKKPGTDKHVNGGTH